VADDGSLVQQAQLKLCRLWPHQLGVLVQLLRQPTKAYMADWCQPVRGVESRHHEHHPHRPLPQARQPRRPGARAAFSDRGNVVSNGRLLSAHLLERRGLRARTADSRIAVFDLDTDTLVTVLEAPCPGLDVGTIDDAGNLYFSNYTGGAGTHWVLGTASNCVVKVVPDTLAVSVN